MKTTKTVTHKNTSSSTVNLSTKLRAAPAALASLILLTTMSTNAWSAREYSISDSAERLRRTQSQQFAQERKVQNLKDTISALKEGISDRESLIRKIRSNQKTEDRLGRSDRKTGLELDYSANASQREQQVSKLQGEIEELKSTLYSKEGELRLEKFNLNEAKISRKEARSDLKSYAKEERIEQGCEKKEFGKMVGSGIVSLADGMRNLFRSRAEREEHEVNKLVKSASCERSEAIAGSTRLKAQEVEVGSSGRAVASSDDGNSSANSARSSYANSARSSYANSARSSYANSARSSFSNTGR
jgi:hypothetical protein